MMQSMGSRRVRHDWTTELNSPQCSNKKCGSHIYFLYLLLSPSNQFINIEIKFYIVKSIHFCTLLVQLSFSELCLLLARLHHENVNCYSLIVFTSSSICPLNKTKQMNNNKDFFFNLF